MNSKPFPIEDVFNQQESVKFLFKFEQLVKHLRVNCNDCHDINLFISTITDNLIHRVTNANYKYETLLYSIPWGNYLFESEQILDPEIFANFLLEYIQIFPNRSEKFLKNFLFVLRGNGKQVLDSTTITVREQNVFASIKTIISKLLTNIKNFERILSSCLLKRFPFFHNTNIHEFVCYISNYVCIIDLLNKDHATELFDYLFSVAIQIDLKQFFNELHLVNKENISTELNFFDFEEFPESSVMNTEQMKKLKVLDFILQKLFDYSCTNSQSCDKWDYRMIFIKIFFERLIVSDSVHLQYLYFFMCAQQSSFCQRFVNELWYMSISNNNPLPVREGCISFLTSFFLNARFVETNTMFSFLRNTLEWLVNYLDSKMNVPSLPDSLSDNDIMYYILCIGFCQLFCVYHADLLPIQIDCLKHLSLKRALINTLYNPLQYLSDDLRDNFVSLVRYYRIGYSNITEIHHRSLSQISANHCENPLKLGIIYLKSIKNKIADFVRNMEILCNTNTEQWESFFLLNNSYRKLYTTQCRSSPNTSCITTSDDALGSSFNGSFTPSTSFLLNHMLSDVDMMDC